jgi:hypothetical protein
MKLLVGINILLGLWLMGSPFLVRLLYRDSFTVTWVDLIFGFTIASISLTRLFSRSVQEYLIADWLLTIVAVLTALNPLLYNYRGDRVAALNNIVIGGAALVIALYTMWKDGYQRV